MTSFLIWKNDPKYATKAKLIDEYLRTCCSAVESESTAKLIESYSRQWDEGGCLSEKQFATLKKIHDDL